MLKNALSKAIKSGINKAVGGDDKKAGVALAVGGMATMLSGQKLASLSMFAKGWQLLEKNWHEEHPEFTGSFKDRWQVASEFYESTHKEKTNRLLHIVGIPMIVGGAAGMLVSPAFSPMWGASAASFVGGWGLNIVGHQFFEKNKPAFTEDPLSFVAGPMWDIKQLVASKLKGGQATAVATH